MSAAFSVPSLAGKLIPLQGDRLQALTAEAVRPHSSCRKLNIAFCTIFIAICNDSRKVAAQHPCSYACGRNARPACVSVVMVQCNACWHIGLKRCSPDSAIHVSFERITDGC